MRLASSSNTPGRGMYESLDNVIQRALILCQGETVSESDILLEGLDWLQADGLQTLLAPMVNPTVDDNSAVVPNVATEQQAADKAKLVMPADGLGNELREQEFSIILDTIRACDGRRKDVAEN